ncbi:MAG: DUF6232 family protein [bacterium]
MEIKEIECPECGAKLKITTGAKVITCEYCHSDFEVKFDEETSKVTKEEKTFYNKNEIIVTNTVVKFRNNIYSTANIASVSKLIQPPDKTTGYILQIIGYIISIISVLVIIIAKERCCIIFLIIGAILIILGQYNIRKKKDVYVIVLRTSSGYISARSSYDEKSIDEIIQSIIEAIHYRG